MSLRELVDTASWTHEPEAAVLDGDVLRVTAVEGSDAWRTTSYGFVHDSEHALVERIDGAFSVEVSFVLDYTEQFDQAGVFLRVDERNWIKAGVEVSDGTPQLGAVVTRDFSDWSVAPVPEWVGRVVTMRVSRDGDAVTVRAWADDEQPRLVRVAYLDPDAAVSAGLLCAAPTRAGLTVSFTGYRVGAPDEALH
ncbi:regulation of enolase protein 1 (concanavalin A-like superfamily) [Curtobacterium sp. PvP017]